MSQKRVPVSPVGDDNDDDDVVYETWRAKGGDFTTAVGVFVVGKNTVRV